MARPMSKGSAPRPLSVPVEDYEASWDAIFRAVADGIAAAKTPEPEKPKDDEPR
jgi:hypothetical protein